MVIPSATRRRLRAAGEDAWREGRAIAMELIDQLREAGAAGIYVMPQFGRYDRAAEVVEACRASLGSSRRSPSADSL